jgi:hypothetical protein
MPGPAWKTAELDLASPDLAPLVPRYLSGWLGLLGLGELGLTGAMQTRLTVQDGEVVRAQSSLREVSISDAKSRFPDRPHRRRSVFSAATPVSVDCAGGADR